MINRYMVWLDTLIYRLECLSPRSSLPPIMKADFEFFDAQINEMMIDVTAVPEFLRADSYGETCTQAAIKAVCIVIDKARGLKP